MVDQPEAVGKPLKNYELPMHISAAGKSVRIGDDVFPYAILKDSITIRPRGRAHSLVTMTLIVGPVTVDCLHERKQESVQLTNPAGEVVRIDPAHCPDCGYEWPN